MLYACPNVKTVTRGAKINTPPMRPFRAPGFVEGTFGLESLLDELAARLDIDPLELRRATTPRRPGSAAVQRQEPGECYRRAGAALGAPARGARPLDCDGQARCRHGLADLVRRGRPAELRVGAVGADGRAAVITALQDVGSGTKTALAQIAAEELGLPLERVSISFGDSARGPYATLRAAPRRRRRWARPTRAAAADAKRQLLELAAQRFDRDPHHLSVAGGKVVDAGGEAGRSARCSDCSATARSSARARAGRTRPAWTRSRSASTSPRSRSTSRPARSPSTASPRSTTSAA